MCSIAEERSSSNSSRQAYSLTPLGPVPVLSLMQCVVFISYAVLRRAVVNMKQLSLFQDLMSRAAELYKKCYRFYVSDAALLDHHLKRSLEYLQKEKGNIRLPAEQAHWDFLHSLWLLPIV